MASGYRRVWHAEVVALCAELRRRGTVAAHELAADLEREHEASIGRGNSTFDYYVHPAHAMAATAALRVIRRPEVRAFIIEGRDIA